MTSPIPILLRATLVSAILVTPPLFTATSATAAAFDCRPYQRSRACPEVVICDTRRLSEADDRMSFVYSERMRQLPDRLAIGLRADQREWLAERNACGCNALCIQRAYDDRIRMLDRY